MKKFKSIICSFFMLIIGITCFACTPNTDPDNNNTTPPATTPTPTEVTVSLDDAKSMVVSSLESETNKTTLNASTTHVGNRNIFVKLGNSELSFYKWDKLRI